ncbi:MAG: hypothetical protein R6U96_18410 [Promethearchaeia archaeon]
MVSYRTSKKRALSLSSPFFELLPDKNVPVQIKTVDIMGVEMFHDVQFKRRS